MELPQKDEKKIEKIYWDKSFGLADYRGIKGIEKIDYRRTYIDSVVAHVQADLIRKAKLRVVVDCANGAGSVTTPYILEKLGCEVVTLNSQPSGEPSRPFEPTIENVQELLQLTKNAGADLGMAHDGDADRAIFVDEKGEYVHGDRSLALIAKDVVTKTKGLVVTPVSSSQCVESVILKAGGKVLYTKVGAPIVAREMYEKHAVFGGEENGGAIFPEHICTRDGAMAAAKVLEILARRKKKFSALLKEIPYYSQFKTKIQCPDRMKQQTLKKLVTKLKKEGKQASTIDGVKIIDKRGWVLIRPSGTEPIFRVFAEGKTVNNARNLAEEGKKLLQSCIQVSK
jgi:phosphomannomutase/phosphoglucomutase